MYRNPQPAYHRIATFRSAQVPATFLPALLLHTTPARARQEFIPFIEPAKEKSTELGWFIKMSLTLTRCQSLFQFNSSPCLFISFLCYPKCDRPRCGILAKPAAEPAVTISGPGAGSQPGQEKRNLHQNWPKTRPRPVPGRTKTSIDCHLAEETRTNKSRTDAGAGCWSQAHKSWPFD